MDIYVQVIFNNINDIDINKQYYKADLIIETKYLIENNNNNSHEIELYKNKQLFKIDNCLNEIKNEIIINNLNKIDDDNLYEIYQQRLISGLFEQEFNLNTYPFDVQTLSIKLKSTNDDFIYLRALQLEPRFINIKNSLNKQQWSIQNCTLTKELSSNDKSPTVVNYFYLFRQSEYLYWNLILPILLILISSTCIYSLDIKLSIEYRLIILSILLLSLIIIKLLSFDLLIQSLKFNLIDKYQLISFCLLISQFIYYLFITSFNYYLFLNSNINDNNTNDYYFIQLLDKLVFLFYLFLIMLLQLWFLIKSKRLLKLRNNYRINEFYFNRHHNISIMKFVALA